MIVGFKITPEDTLIIFDEIQEIPKALTSLKFFMNNFQSIILSAQKVF